MLMAASHPRMEMAERRLSTKYGRNYEEAYVALARFKCKMSSNPP
jgi:hypothetical protein